jgi:hypothetical protein
MDAKGKHRVITDMLAEPQADMLAAVDQMPKECGIGWYFVHRTVGVR